MSFSLTSINSKHIQQNNETKTYATSIYDWENPPLLPGQSVASEEDEEEDEDDDDTAPPQRVSGIWKPIIISHLNDGPKYCEPLTFSKSDKSSSFFPCNCNAASFSSEAEGFYDTIETSSVSCTYCNTATQNISWYLYDEAGNSSIELTASGCCDGICDTRLNKDDYLPKIPMLNQSMLTGFVDFKYMNEFPGCSNPGLGQERYYKYNREKLKEDTRLNLTNCDMYIDWKMKECISEIPYEALTSQHNSQYVHEKTYKRALTTSKTAGNFIILDEETGIFDIPEIDDFKAPYGFNNSTYNNIFKKGEKIASYWKWNYLSGVQCWQRYFEGNYETYISPGDFFYVTLDGPEPNPPAPSEPDPNDPPASDRVISKCPSGLKVVDGTGEVVDIIPSGTKAVYISENIYPLFKSIFDRVIAVASGGNPFLSAVDIAGTLATGPQYDNITTDLLSTDGDNYIKNEFFQISGMNQNMNSGMHYGSAFNFGYCKTDTDIINVLRHKYGQYIWIPPRTKATIEITETSNGFVEFDFDMVLSKDKIKHSNTNATSLPNNKTPISNKSFTYKLSSNSFSCNPFGDSIYARSCSVETGLNPDNSKYKKPVFEIESSLSLQSINFDGGYRYAPGVNSEFKDKYPRIVLDEENIEDYCSECDPKSSYYIAGSSRTLCKQEDFCDYTLADYFRGNRKYRKISDNSLVMHRKYYAQAANARIDAVAVHPNYGSAIESEMFGLNKSKAFFQINNDNKSSTRGGNVKVEIETYDVGIKIYDLRYEPLQTDNSTMHNKRFPVNYDNLCSCEPIIAQYKEYNYFAGQGSVTLGPAQGYTPNLSVANFSPSLKKYGGYKQEYLDENFPGEGLVYNVNLEDIPYRIDPEYPFGRSSLNKSVTLPNYHTTEWSFNTSANTLSVSENVDLYGQSYKFFEDEYGDNEEMNKNWKRFTTRVEVNSDKHIYNQQETYITPGNVDITLVNPFLEKLTGGKKVLHPPTVTGANYFFDNVWGLFGPRGDEMSSVTLNFSSRQSKHLCYFTGKVMGHNDLELEPVEFKIDKGIKSGGDNSSHIGVSGLINFDDLEDIPDTLCFKGSINNNFVNTLNNIYKVGKEKKPKLVISYDNTLYIYEDYDIEPFSYVIPSQNKLFEGPALLYEYVNSKDSAHIPYVSPIHKKFQPSLIAKYNSVSYDFRNLDTTSKPFGIPVKKNILSSNLGTIILLPGARHYFCIKTDQSVIEANIGFNDVASLDADTAATIDYRDLVSFGFDDLFMYVGGEYSLQDRMNPSNYLYMPNIQSARLFTNFSNLSIDLSNAGNKSTIANSVEKTDNHSIVLYDNFGRKSTRLVSTRELIIKKYLPNNRETRKADGTNFRLFTQLKLIGSLNKNIEYFIDSINSDKNTSLVFYNNAVFSEHIDKDMLYPNIMYGDLENYDGNILNQPIVISNFDFNSLPIPKTAYENLFYKLMLSDLQKNISFKLKQIIPELDEDGEPTGEIAYGDEFELADIDNIQYNIVQKYAIDELNLEEKYYIDSNRNYENYLGILDVNIFDREFPKSKNPNVEYLVKSNRLWSDAPDSTEYCFLLNLNKAATLIDIGAGPFSSTTMSVRSTPFHLKKITKTESNANIEWVSLATSRKLDNLYSQSVAGNVVQKREYPFIVYDLYNFPVNCGGELGDRDCNAYLDNRIELYTQIAFSSGVNTSSISASDLQGQNIKIGLSYDDGLGMNLSSSNLYTKIERSFDTTSLDICNIDSQNLLPELIYNQKQDSAYWSNVVPTNYSVGDEGVRGVTAKTDEYANEMLFRILYGQKEKHNRERLFYEEEAITYAKLVDNSYEIEAKDIYKEIPYNYDRSADMTNFYMSHTINVYGTGGDGEQVVLNIGNNTLSFRFGYNSDPTVLTQHKVNVNLNGEVTSSYTQSLQGDIRSSKFDYLLYYPTPDSEPPAGTKVGSVQPVLLTAGYGWRVFRYYTGDPRVLGSCSQTGPASNYLANCPAGTLLGTNYDGYGVPSIHGGDTYEIENGGCGCTTKTVPIITSIENPGIEYECEDGTKYAHGLGDLCGKYSYGSYAGSDGYGNCIEFRERTEGTIRPYYFQNCRTNFMVTASVGVSTQKTSSPDSDSYAEPSTSYSSVGCTEGSCRGYVRSIYATCGGALPYAGAANGYAADCNTNFIYPDEPTINPNAVGCTSTRDPGYDQCAMVSSSDDTGIIKGDIYRIIIPGLAVDYEPPTCPTQLLSITYTTDSLTITIAGKTRCFSLPYKKECKKAKITLPNRDYYITESIESECNSNKHLPNVTLTDGKQEFLTVDTQITFGIGTYAAADVNETSPIMWGNGAIPVCDRGSSSFTGAWVGIGLCGSSSGPWISPDGIEDFKGLAQTAIGEFVSRITQLATNFNTAGSDHISANRYAEAARWAKDPHYFPASNLLRGPLGGASVGFSFKDEEFTRINDAGSSTFKRTTVTAYVTMPYRIPKSTASLINESVDSNVCVNNYDSAGHNFPDWYGDLTGARKFDEILQEYDSPNIISNNFAMMNSYFYIDCEGVKSDYNDAVLTDRIRIMPCPANDYVCWIKQGWTETIGQAWR